MAPYRREDINPISMAPASPWYGGDSAGSAPNYSRDIFPLSSSPSYHGVDQSVFTVNGDIARFGQDSVTPVSLPEGYVGSTISVAFPNSENPRARANREPYGGYRAFPANLRAGSQFKPVQAPAV